jgi:hypothetical protein
MVFSCLDPAILNSILVFATCDELGRFLFTGKALQACIESDQFSYINKAIQRDGLKLNLTASQRDRLAEVVAGQGGFTDSEDEHKSRSCGVAVDTSCCSEAVSESDSEMQSTESVIEITCPCRQ